MIVSTKKKLFQITELSTQRVVPGLWFDNKPEAKKKREELNAGQFKFVVSPGPDHHARRP